MVKIIEQSKIAKSPETSGRSNETVRDRWISRGVERSSGVMRKHEPERISSSFHCGYVEKQRRLASNISY